MRKPNKKEVLVIREIANSHGIKGCRMSLRSVLVGKQSVRVDSEKARQFIAALSEAGFGVDELVHEAIELGLADVFMVHSKN